MGDCQRGGKKNKSRSKKRKYVSLEQKLRKTNNREKNKKREGGGKID